MVGGVNPGGGVLYSTPPAPFLSAGVQWACMSSELSDAEKRGIIETYKDLGSINKTTEAVEHSKKTVSKYVNKWKDGELDNIVDDDDGSDDGSGSEASANERRASAPSSDDGGEGGGTSAPEGYTADPPPKTREELDDGRPDFEEMSPGDFVKWFFDQDGFGVRTGFVNRLASRCDVRDELPDENNMVNTIVEGNSGISNSFDARMVAESYGSALDNYRREKGMGNSSSERPRTSGSWVGAEDESHARGGASAGGSGEWVPAEDGYSADGGSDARGGQRSRRARSPEGRRAQGRGGHNPDGGQQGGRRGGQSDGSSDEVADALRELKETQNKMAQMIMQMQRDGGGGDDKPAPQSFKEQAEELAEAHSALEKALGDDDSERDPEVEALKEELQQIRAQVAEGGGDSPVRVEGDGAGGLGAIAQLATREDVDPDTLSILADSMGVTDPEVKKAEYEFKQTKEQLKNRQELMDNFFDNLGDVSGDLVGSALESFTNGDGSGEQQQQTQQQAQQPSPEGNQTMDTGDIQVVGEDVGGGESGNSSGGDEVLSPARRRHQEKVEGDDGGPGGVGGFRGPGSEQSSDSDGIGPQEGCQFTDDDGNVCGAPTDDHPVFCDEHVGSVGGDFQ